MCQFRGLKQSHLLVHNFVGHHLGLAQLSGCYDLLGLAHVAAQLELYGVTCLGVDRLVG